MIQGKMKRPISILITLTIFIPVVIYIIMHTTTSLVKYSQIYQEGVVNFKREKKKINQFLSSQLPRFIIHQLKKGEAYIIPRPSAPSPFSYVSFPQLSSELTAHQIIDLLIDLYNQFDDCKCSYDMLKTIGNTILIATGIPYYNELHAPEICRMSL